MIEPDSLANLVTNTSVKKCAESDAIYRGSIAYAISALSMPHVSLYLDAGHSGWLGWDAHRAKIAAIFKDVLDRAGGAQKIRGFATNVSGYGVLRGDDGRRLEPSNPCPDELTYVEKLSGDLAKVGITGKGFVIDTSRNGRAGIRSKSGHWCNIKGAGLGERPRASPAPNVDAYFWIKVPGESDGTSDPKAPGFDATCASEDATPDAPAAGTFFPALSSSGSWIARTRRWSEALPPWTDVRRSSAPRSGRVLGEYVAVEQMIAGQRQAIEDARRGAPAKAPGAARCRARSRSTRAIRTPDPTSGRRSAPGSAAEDAPLPPAP